MFDDVNLHWENMGARAPVLRLNEISEIKNFFFILKYISVVSVKRTDFWKK